MSYGRLIGFIILRRGHCTDILQREVNQVRRRVHGDPCEDRRYSVDWKIDPPSGVRRAVRAFLHML